jgi:hypothetical protein
MHVYILKRTDNKNIILDRHYLNFILSAMKRILLTTTLIMAFCLATFARKFVAEGQTYSALGNYKIETSDNPVTLNGKTLKAFVISYTNSNMEVTVAFEKNRRGMKYYVLSDNLSVQYVCQNGYFGVAKLDKELEKDGFKTSESALNRGEYFHQKVISTGGICDLENSKLIAAYYPMLINNFENILTSL